jgi:hypothetical protein
MESNDAFDAVHDATMWRPSLWHFDRHVCAATTAKLSTTTTMQSGSFGNGVFVLFHKYHLKALQWASFQVNRGRLRSRGTLTSTHSNSFTLARSAISNLSSGKCRTLASHWCLVAFHPESFTARLGWRENFVFRRLAKLDCWLLVYGKRGICNCCSMSRAHLCCLEFLVSVRIPDYFDVVRPLRDTFKFGEATDMRMHVKNLPTRSLQSLSLEQQSTAWSAEQQATVRSCFS